MTETIFFELLKWSPLGAILLGIIWYLYKELIKRDNNYKDLVKEIRQESSNREERILEDSRKRENNLMKLLDKLTEKFNVVDDMKSDIEYIKNHIEK